MSLYARGLVCFVLNLCGSVCARALCFVLNLCGIVCAVAVCFVLNLCFIVCARALCFSSISVVSLYAQGLFVLF